MTASFLQWYIVKLQETKLLLIIDAEEKSGNVSKMSSHAGTAEAVKWFAIYFSPTLTLYSIFLHKSAKLLLNSRQTFEWNRR